MGWSAAVLYGGINQVRQFLRKLCPSVLQHGADLYLHRSVEYFDDDVDGSVTIGRACATVDYGNLRKGSD